jgi:hypothetical protein
MASMEARHILESNLKADLKLARIREDVPLLLGKNNWPES